MKVLTVGFIISQLLVPLNGETSLKKSRIKKEADEILIASESKYQSKNPYFGYSKRGYDEKDLDLPVIFQAPHYNANDYWNYEHEDIDRDNRRTFFEDHRYEAGEKRKTFPSFYQFMNSLFGGRNYATTTNNPFLYERNNPTLPNLYDTYSFGQRTKDANYIPPPKPIRASVIKLETITRSPVPQVPFIHDTTNKFSHYLGSILNHVLIENSKKQHHHDLSFHYQSQTNDNPIPVIPQHVLPKPIYVRPTTLRPLSFFDNRTQDYQPKRPHPRRYNYPNSVQDQLPHLNIEDVKIPYISETTLTTTLHPQTDPETPRHFNYAGNPFFRRNTTTNLIDIRNLNWVAPNTSKRPVTAEISRLTKIEAYKNRPERKLPQTIQDSRSSVELITNLTVEGLSKSDKENVNIHSYVNFFNMKNLINYEKKKLEVQPRTESEKEAATIVSNNSSLSSVNLNDELSLDAKILKDTNWDGLTTTQSLVNSKIDIKSFPRIPETTTTITTKPIFRTTPKLFFETTTFFDELVNLTTPSREFTETTASINEIVTAIDDSFETTTQTKDEIIFTTTEQPFIRRSELLHRETTVRPVTDELPFEATTITEKPLLITPRRKYSRRPKVLNFTSYNNSDELRKKIANRNNFPKRQKPNITLTFGNKNIIKVRQSYGRDEVMKFSDEDLAKTKRKVGKRRHLLRRIKTSSSERPQL